MCDIKHPQIVLKDDISVQLLQMHKHMALREKQVAAAVCAV